MKKICFLLIGILALIHVNANEITNKANALAIEYQQAENLTPQQTLDVENLLYDYFSTINSGGVVVSSLQSQVDAIFNSLLTTASGVPLTATNVEFSVSSILNASSPSFQRINGISFDPSNVCQTTTSQTTSQYYYEVIPFTVVTEGDVDIEVMSGSYDVYIHLYCDFDPLNALENVVASDDDGGAGLLSRIQIPSLPTGTYYLVVTSYGSLITGTCDIEFRSDTGILKQGEAVPIGKWWIAGIFVLLGIGVFVKKIFF